MVSAHILAKYIQEVTHKVSQFEKNMRLAPACGGSMGLSGSEYQCTRTQEPSPGTSTQGTALGNQKVRGYALIVGCIQEPFDAPDTRRMTQFAQCFRLYLADTLACDVKLTANLF